MREKTHTVVRRINYMNPVFVFLVLVGAVILWFLLSALFYPFGRFLYRIWKDAADEINREENKEKDKENE